ncbi:MAG: hypothetical protein ACRDHZ_08115 [Ktedonobacteraceae bacterium]
MIWVAWRQHRTEFLLMGSVFIIALFFLLITSLMMAQTFHQLGLDTCLSKPHASFITCDLVFTFATQYVRLTVVPEVIGIGLTILLGMFVGAPLVARELEQGTHHLIWVQSITRLRWLGVKLALILGVGILLFCLVSVALYWGYAPLYQSGTASRFALPGFDVMGPVFPASATLALALGIFVGTLTRRTVLAIFLTFVLILAIRLPVEFILRPNYLPPITQIGSVGPISATQTIPEAGGWLLDSGVIDAQGHKSHLVACPGLSPCTAPAYTVYQPADRYWTFQWIETGIYLALVVVALGATTWLVKRRLN